MNDYVGHQGRFDAMYYWDQFHPILSAIAILIIGWIIALLIAGAVKKVLTKLGTNQKLSSATGHRSNIENIISRVVFWLILIIAVIGALNVLNLTSVSGPFSNMVQQLSLGGEHCTCLDHWLGVGDGLTCNGYRRFDRKLGLWLNAWGSCHCICTGFWSRWASTCGTGFDRFVR